MILLEFNQLMLIIMMLIVIMVIITNKLIYKNISKSQITLFSKFEFYEQKLLDIEIMVNLLKLNKNQDYVKQINNSNKFNDLSATPTNTNTNIVNNHTSSQILRLLNNKSLTSRDIQKSINKTREHVARIMKKLYENGYVIRNTDTRPFNYSITKQGRQVFINSL